MVQQIDSEVGQAELDVTDPHHPALHLISTDVREARARVPFRPEGSYEVRATIVRKEGQNAFVLILPIPGPPATNLPGQIEGQLLVAGVGPIHGALDPRPNVALYVDYDVSDGAWSGLRAVNPKHPGGRMANTFGGRLRAGIPYPLYVRVIVARDKVSIRAELADRVLVDWSGRASDLNGGPWQADDNSRLGLGVLDGAFRIERLEARLMPGTGPTNSPVPSTLHGMVNAPWTDLLPLVDASLDRESGTVTKFYEGPKAVALVGPGVGRLARVAVPVRPDGNYEVRTRITRLTGTDSFNLMLPVPGTASQTQIGVRLDMVHNGDVVAALDWPSGFFMPLGKTLQSSLKPGQPYDVVARITTVEERVRVRVEVNGVPVLEWDGPIAEARNGMTAFTANRRCVGFGATASTFRVEGFEFRMIRGSASLGRPAAARVTEEPKELAGGPDAPWVGLLEGLSLPASIVDGSWGWSGDVQKLSLSAGVPQGKRGRFALPIRPKGDYELRLRFARTDGDDGLVAMMPIPSADGKQVVLFVDGQKAQGASVPSKDDPRRTPLKISKGERLTNNTAYTLAVRVTGAARRATIRAELDGKQVLDWTGPAADLPPADDWSTPDRSQLGLGVWDNCRYRIEAVEFRPLSGTAEWRPGKAVAAAPSAEKPGQVRRFGRYKGGIGNIVLSPDGADLFVTDAGASRWNVGTGDMAWENDQTAGGVLALSGDGKVLTAWGQDGLARVLDPATGKVERKFAIPPEQVGHAILNKDGSRAVVSFLKTKKGVKPTVGVWDVAKGTELFGLVGNMDDTYGLAFSPDGTRLATASYDKKTRLWDAANGKLQHTFDGHTAGVSAVAFSADGKYLVTGGGDNVVRIWSVEDKRAASVLPGHTEWITDVAFTPDGTRVVSASGYEGKGDGVRVWDWRAGTEIHHFAEVKGQLTGIAVTPDGRRAVTAGADGSVRVLRLPVPVPRGPEAVGPVRRFGRYQGPTSSVALSKDGKCVYVLDTAIVKWELTAERLVWSEGNLRFDLTELAASQDDKTVLVGFADGSVGVLDAQTGKKQREFTRHTERIVALAISTDGKRAVSSSADREKHARSIRVWNVETAQELFELKGPAAEVWSLAFSANGTRIAGASDDGTIRLWDATTGDELHVFRGHKGEASAVTFSPDGKFLVSGGQDLTVRVWSVEKKEQVHALEGHDVWITDVAFTPDGTRILSVGGNVEQEASEGLRVWDARTGKSLYEGVKSGIHAVGLAAAPDNKYAVTGGADGSIRVWKLPDPPRQ